MQLNIPGSVLQLHRRGKSLFLGQKTLKNFSTRLRNRDILHSANFPTLRMEIEGEPNGSKTDDAVTDCKSAR